MSGDQWSRWSQSSIVENEFFTQGVDFIKLDIMSSSPNPPNEYAVTIEFAKHIAMMAKTKRAHVH
jgi:anti-repressor protein